MPCYTVTLVSVELKVANKEMLDAALKALGLSYTESNNVWNIRTPAGQITITNGVAQFYNQDCQKWVNKIKEMYSLKTVEKVAKKYKFTLTTKSNNQIVLRRY